MSINEQSLTNWQTIIQTLQQKSGGKGSDLGGLAWLPPVLRGGRAGHGRKARSTPRTTADPKDGR